ncbi:hypothetical protein [Anaeroselena agilis]|uniref:Uncharacterized protein n=1 Tax=Anaeroselena agilis TaxID=3063788 RepID=A0ABU3P2Z1_9FIRM|nr:hypothetical protein [Selenomonadales bacterium 4137-cl]
MPDKENQGGSSQSSRELAGNTNNNDQQGVQSPSGGQQSTGQGQNKASQEVPLTAEQQKAAQAIQKQIEAFESMLGQKSNSELKEIATRLETVEREMLLEKIDQQLQTMKETIVKPGDAAASAAAAGAATVVLNESPT